jgi:uncharacterized phage protein gp47/JayE
MSFARPSLSQLITRIEGDLKSRVPGAAGGILRRSVLAVIARVVAGAVHGVYGFIGYLARQFFPDQSEADWLVRHASLFGITRKAARKATGPVTFTGSDGATIPAGTVLLRDDGAEYTTDAAGTIQGGSVDIDVTAASAGIAGNTSTGVTLTLDSPLSSVDSEATTTGDGLTGGTDAETDDNLRSRLLQRMRETPQGGSDQDYVRWAREVAGVTRAWVFPNNTGLGTVGVTFVRDEDNSIIPSTSDVDDVQAHIDDRRPVTADVTVFAPTSVALDFEIRVTPDTTDVRDAIEAELRDLIMRDAAPRATIYISRIREAISIAKGESTHDLISPTSDVTHSQNELPVFGSITWS